MATVRRDVPFTQIPDWIIEADISHATFRVYAAICRRVDKTRTAFPGLRRIAADARVSKQTVITAISNLEKIGAIEVTRDKSNHYWLPLIPFGDGAVQPLDQGVVQPLDQGGLTIRPDGGLTSRPELYPVRTTPNNKKDVAGRQNPTWDAIVDILGAPSDTQRTLQGKLVAELNRNDIDADEIRRIARRFATEYGPGKLTLGALAKNWARWRDSVALAHMTDDQMAEWEDEQKRAARRLRLERSHE